jgi:CheY-like chemotaxis protein
VLEEIGNHEVQVAYDGESGLKLAKKFHPEVVLLDIGLPGIDGYEVAKRLRGEPEGDHLLVAAVTGYGQEEDRRRSKEAGFDEHLLKPVALDVVRGLFRHPKLVQHQVA